MSAVWFLVNPAAGGGRALRHAARAAQGFTGLGHDVRMVQPASSADTTEAARAAVQDGASAVIVCGGDGTVHDAAQALVTTGVPLGIVAAGSGDDIATSLGFSGIDPAEQARRMVALLSGGGPRLVDTGEASVADGTRRAFVGVLSTGFDSSVNERANRMGRLAGQRYNVAMVRELTSFRPRAYRVVMDGQVVVDTGMLVTIGNTPRFGGGMLVCPDARPDDGLLDVTWLAAVSKAEFLRMFPRVYRGTHVLHPAVTTYRARRLQVEADGQVAYADGERIGPLPVTVEVRPASLAVLSVPGQAVA